MRFENDQGWVQIEFAHYAEDAFCWSSGLFDERNCVELNFNFSMKDIGWGCVGEEYFLTTDIQALAKGTAAILFSATDHFSHSVAFPYKTSLDEKEFCRFRFSRNDDKITVNLRIWDGLCEYIEITQLFDENSFGTIVDELKAAAKRLPVR